MENFFSNMLWLSLLTTLIHFILLTALRLGTKWRFQTINLIALLMQIVLLIAVYNWLTSYQ